MEERTIIKARAPNYRASKHMKQKRTKLKDETDNSTITVGEFS